MMVVRAFLRCKDSVEGATFRARECKDSPLCQRFISRRKAQDERDAAGGYTKIGARNIIPRSEKHLRPNSEGHTVRFATFYS